MKVNVLGTEYTVTYLDENDQIFINGSRDGVCDTSVKEIVIADFKSDGPNTIKDLDAYKNQVLRHEIIHAFLHESGLDVCSDNQWAKNEEMVDWLAIQFPKITRAFQSVEKK